MRFALRIAVAVSASVLPSVLSSQSAPVFFGGQPLVSMAPDRSDLFQAGRRIFAMAMDVDRGLGPGYNGSSCGDCHNQPVPGGVGNSAAVHAGIVRDGRYNAPIGGDLVHLFSTGDHSCQARIPADANNVVRRIPSPLFGAGLVEAIPDSVILSWEDPTDRNGDGVRGRAAMITDPGTQTMRVGRFGWKAQQATLIAFAAQALRDEMGITNDLFPNEIGMGLSPEQLAACGGASEPEDKADPKTHLRGIDHLTNFMRFLAPVAPLPQDESAHHGMELFSRIGCAACHIPQLLTGPSDVPALDHKPVNAYSDFLLHDIGTGDGVEQGAAQGNEFRTSPLWGLRSRKLLMHDGSALNPADAIRQHRNEGDRSHQAFERLDGPDKRALVDFLATL